MMAQSNLTVGAVPRRSIVVQSGVAMAPVPERADHAGNRIRLRLAVASTSVLAIRQALCRALAGKADVHVADVDYRHHGMTLHLDVSRDDRYAAMDAVMSVLPAAEFGFTTELGASDVAH